MVVSGFWLSTAFITGTVMATSPIAEKRNTSICFAAGIIFCCCTKRGLAQGRYTFSSGGIPSCIFCPVLYLQLAHPRPAKGRFAAVAGCPIYFYAFQAPHHQHFAGYF